MAQVIININHREYAISCENGEEAHIMKLGRLLDDKAHSLTQALGPINENQLLAMVGLLVADDLAELKKKMAEAPAPVLNSAPVQPAPTPAPAPEPKAPAVTEQDLEDADTAIAEQLNSLNAAIKSIALKLKSI